MATQGSGAPPLAASGPHPELAGALSTFHEVLLAGLRHGFFQCSVSVEIIANGKRRLIISAGNSYRFVIPAEACGHGGTVPRFGSTTSASEALP